MLQSTQIIHLFLFHNLSILEKIFTLDYALYYVNNTILSKFLYSSPYFSSYYYNLSAYSYLRRGNLCSSSAFFSAATDATPLA